jgi:hypothetical protein
MTDTKKVGMFTRIGYILFAFMLFGLGIVCFLFAGLLITIPLGLAMWLFALKFVHLAWTGRSYGDWNAELNARKELNKEKDQKLVQQKKMEMADET